MVKRFLDDERGNIAITFSVLIFVILMGVGAAIDMSKLVSQKQKIADIADSTALAAALVARDGHDKREKDSEEFFEEQRLLETEIDVNDMPSIIFDDGAKEVTVTVSSRTSHSFMNMFGHVDKDISASATVGYAIDYVPPITLAFAFDTSGSMQWLTTDGQVKIDALEAATGDLFSAMFTASENPGLLQTALSTAFSTYNTDVLIHDVPRQGYQHILDTMSTDPLFMADGGTNSTPSVQFAITQLLVADATEPDSKWSGHLVFMTDGDNNDPLSDTETLAACTSAKAQGFTIYTVGFALDPARPNARNLLENCASDVSKFFESSNADALKESFHLIGGQLGEATVRLKG